MKSNITAQWGLSPFFYTSQKINLALQQQQMSMPQQQQMYPSPMPQQRQMYPDAVPQQQQMYPPANNLSIQNEVQMSSIEFLFLMKNQKQMQMLRLCK